MKTIKIPKSSTFKKEMMKQRTGSFIGMLDGKIGNLSSKEMKKIYNEDLS